MSQVLCGQLKVFASLIDGTVKPVEDVAQCGARRCEAVADLGEPGTHQAKIGAAEEHGHVRKRLRLPY